jgi:DNA-binding NarL/FixJ family response regulator
VGDALSTTQPRREGLRVLLVDDHDLFRAGLRSVLVGRGISIVGEAMSGEDAVELVSELSPDVVLMDLSMPGMGGIEATRRISQLAPLAHVLVLTVSDRDADVVEAISAGACGYLLKDASLDELVRGIQSAASGESPVSPAAATKLLERVRATSPDPERAARIRSELSRREIEVLKLIANGKDNTEIARELVISPKTVKNHTSSILAKLQIENRIQAAVYAVRAGLV